MSLFRTDLPLVADESTRFLPWIAGLLTFIATLTLAGLVFTIDLSQKWTLSLDRSLTVEIAVTDTQTPEIRAQRVAAVMGVLKATEGVISAVVLDEQNISELLEPWLGENLALSSLPFPTLIAVQIAPEKMIDLKKLGRALQDAAQARVEDHGVWRDHVIAFLGALQSTALVIIISVLMAVIIMIVFATRGGLAAHRSTIELLHLIGARDTYIARQFQRRILFVTLIGGVPGAVSATALCYYVLDSGQALRRGVDVISHLTPQKEAGGLLGISVETMALFEGVSPWMVVLLVLLAISTPFLMACITILSTRYTVFARLRGFE